jgi:hypothetical protein
MSLFFFFPLAAYDVSNFILDIPLQISIYCILWPMYQPFDGGWLRYVGTCSTADSGRHQALALLCTEALMAPLLLVNVGELSPFSKIKCNQASKTFQAFRHTVARASLLYSHNCCCAWSNTYVGCTGGILADCMLHVAQVGWSHCAWERKPCAAEDRRCQ